MLASTEHMNLKARKKGEKVMERQGIAREFAALPLEAQDQVIDFIDFLKTRYADVKEEKKRDFSDEPFIGIWHGREDMRDSGTWVKKLRKSEWALKDE